MTDANIAVVGRQQFIADALELHVTPLNREV